MSCKSIVFDLDDTICFPNHEHKTTELKYGKAKPNLPVITAMHSLKQKGFHITISTARRMLTHNGNIQEIVNDVGDITVNWLKDHNVPYDELIFGKPYSTSYYVDDKAMSVERFLQTDLSTL